MIKAAFVIGFKPSEFWALTPREFAACNEGYQVRQSNQMRMLAWHAANVMNASGNLRHPVGVEELLGEKRKPVMDKQGFQELKKRLGFD